MKEAEEIIIKVLRFGVLVSGFLIFVGLVLLYANGLQHENIYQVNSIDTMISGLKSFDPYSIIMLGLLVLIITPVLRVISSIIVFYLEKDFLYVRITVIVLIILMVSLFIGIYF